ncbi:uncharacterized protein [Haliotis cracherodii]|uniref:uncharacterized protein n=1 Tax=Haliotis cracherodii TaxID=6455 RepID=UPI0039E8CC26
MNPVGTNGKTLACGSFRHSIAHCPHSWENMSKVHYVEGGSENEETVEQVILFTRNIKDNMAQLGNDARCCAVLDSACSSTVCGRMWLDVYMDSLDKKDRDTVTRCEGVKMFKFGGGEKLKSQGSYELPAFMAGKNVRIRTDVVDSDIPLLLSLRSMKEACVKLDLEHDSAEILGEKVSLNYTSSGHYCIPIDKYEKMPVEVNAVLLHKMEDDERYKVILKLHRQFAHPPERKLVALMKDAGVWQNEFQDTISKIYRNCQMCKAYTRTPARPAVALPMASQFNETVAMDLKKWGSRWILYLVDMWSRLTISVFIQRKTPSEVIDKIMTHGIGAGFGVMQAILTDNG